MTLLKRMNMMGNGLYKYELYSRFYTMSEYYHLNKETYLGNIKEDLLESVLTQSKDTALEINGELYLVTQAKTADSFDNLDPTIATIYSLERIEKRHVTLELMK